MSKAMLRPVSPWSSSSLKRWFVSSALPKPLKMRIVHGLPR